MRNFRTPIRAGILLAATSSVAPAQLPSGNGVPVTVENYIRAQSDVYFGQIVKTGAFGKQASLKKVHAVLLLLGETISDTRRMFGAARDQVDPVRHLVGTALVWGGLPEKDALYLPVRRPKMTAPPFTSSRSRTCPSTASGQSQSTMPRAIWNRTHTTPMP